MVRFILEPMAVSSIIRGYMAPQPTQAGIGGRLQPAMPYY